LKNRAQTGKETASMSKFLLPASADQYYGTLAMIRRLLAEEGVRYWKKYFVAFVLMAIVAGCTALIPYFFGRVINEANVDRNMRGVLIGAGVIFALFLGKGIATYWQTLILARVANNIVASNQRRVFAKLLSENLGFYADRHSSEFIARLTAGATAIGQMLNLLVTSVGRDLLSLIGLAIVMVIQDPVMSLSALIIAPPALFLLRKMVKRIYAIARAQYHGGAQALETLQETLQGIRIVKAFTLEDEMRARFDRQVGTVEQESNKMARVANRASPLMEMLGGLALALATVYGGYRTIVQGAAPGEFFSFIAAFLMAYEPAKRLARLNMELNNGLVGTRLLFEILDSPASELSDDDKPALRPSIERVEFNDVRFAYRSDDSVLRDMSFIAEPGTTTALVGPSGGGKSTIFNLLLRFYEPEGGKITIGGQDISAVSRQSLRQHIAYVGQDVFLFRGTIRDNIACGKPGATHDDIIAAAKGAHAHDFILAFPQGYDTEVGEHGLQLSGGQRQRIAIARALVKDAPVVLLDEATAALDSESELLVREAMTRLCQGKTTLAIAHRLHTISHADRIHVVEDGRVVESGRHDELLRKGGRYAMFYRLQLKQQETPEPAVASR
jgi:ATP-binding cassette subfamily B protein